ncbi:trypsin-like serine peptidase [Streptomyces sp. NPDC020490]|uniref:trypsin-like serine peptidase n=1 Tax=Streptomyces sp. NPDC020490 TaxID=3365078 RepID=UPI0037A40930
MTVSPERKRASRTAGPVCLAVMLLVPALTSASLAAADDGPGPLGVTAVVPATASSARVGALFGADGHFCTASVVRSPHRDLIVTAAHCLGGGGDLTFVPGYRDGAAPYGVWRIRERFVPEGWSERSDEDSDVGFAVLEDQGGRGVEDVVGGNRFTTGTATGATPVTVTGYPNAREVPVGCTQRPTPYGSTQQRIECPDLTGGTSGSPWVDGDDRVVGVLGGHERGGSTADVSYSAVLGTEAAELYREASGGL